jgi:fructoselysine-6-phosphate deglycase
VPPAGIVRRVNAAADDTSSESFYVQSLCVALSIMKQRGEVKDDTTLAAELPAMPGALLAMKEAFEPHTERLARLLLAKY